jgi:hypothetical protein
MAVESPQILPLEWFCEGCGDAYEDEAAAFDCCDYPPTLGYGCPLCGVAHQTESDAIACCRWDQTPGGARAIQQAIEAAGQLRLQLP